MPTENLLKACRDGFAGNGKDWEGDGGIPPRKVHSHLHLIPN